MQSNAVNWFEQDGSNYARFRPQYPPALAEFLAGTAPRRMRALDVGCGTGQLTMLLAGQFHKVTGTDTSEEQLSHAVRHQRITYLRAPAEQIPLAGGSVDLITAAQAAHWFQLESFYGEVRRIASPGAVLALISYGVLALGDLRLNRRFSRFYHEEIGPFWPPERKLVEAGYAGIDFPFAPLQPPALTIERDWNLQQLLGYLSTWSAVRHAVAKGRQGILAGFARDLTAAWGDSERLQRVVWPISMRIGRVRIP